MTGDGRAVVVEDRTTVGDAPAGVAPPAGPSATRLRRLGPLALVVVLVAAVAWAVLPGGSEDGPRTLDEWGRLVAQRPGPATQPEPAWHVDRPQPFAASIVVDGDLVVVGASDASQGLAALDRQTGAARWELPVSGALITSSLAVEGSTVAALTIIGSGSQLDVVDRATGALRWSLPVVGRGRLTISGDRLILETHRAVPEVSVTILDLGGAVLADVPGRLAGLDGSTVVVFDRDRAVGLDPTDGAARWEIDLTRDPAVESAAYVDGVLVASGGGIVDARTPAGGPSLWRVGLVGAVKPLGDGLVGIAESTGRANARPLRFVALDLDGRVRWRIPAADVVRVAVDDVPLGYFELASRTLAAVDLRTGRIVARGPAGGTVRDSGTDVLLLARRWAAYGVHPISLETLWQFEIPPGGNVHAAGADLVVTSPLGITFHAATP